MAATNPTPPILTVNRIKRFWNRVSRGAPTECWPWLGWDNYGYGVVVIRMQPKKRGRKFRAHRVAHFIATGEWAENVLHSCDVPRCCNPAHLRSGTAADNVADKVSRGRMNPARGERSGTSKLTTDTVRAVRAFLAEGHTCRETHKKFGVNIGTVYDLWKRRSWAWLD